MLSYKLLDCTTIDIVHRRIGRRNFIYDIICDDEGLMKEDAKVSAIDDMGIPMLVGNLFIVKFDGEESETSLDESDIEYIMRHIFKFATRRFPKPYPMLCQCAYQ